MAMSVLKQIIEQHADEPRLAGSLACHLRQNEPVEQHHRDGRELGVYWRERAGHWRCTVFAARCSDHCIAQVDLHDDKTVRVEVHEPASIAINPQLGVLVLVRFKSMP